MDLFSKFELQARLAAQVLSFDITYIPGVTEDLDRYKASHEQMGINCYGDTEDLAISSARMEATGLFIERSSLAEQILRTVNSNRKVRPKKSV
jgi:hypothetical protein